MPDLSGFSVTMVCVADDCVLLVVPSKFVPTRDNTKRRYKVGRIALEIYAVCNLTDVGSLTYRFCFTGKPSAQNALDFNYQLWGNFPCVSQEGHPCYHSMKQLRV